MSKADGYSAPLFYFEKEAQSKVHLSQATIRSSHTSTMNNILFHRTASQVQCELAVKPRDPGPVRCRTQTKSTLRDAELWQGSLARPA